MQPEEPRPPLASPAPSTPRAPRKPYRAPRVTEHEDPALRQSVLDAPDPR
jgi:hypothetical protein